MTIETYEQIQPEREKTMAFNMGLQTAIYVLEKAETLSTEGRRFLLEELRRQIAESESVTRSNG